MNAWSCTFLLLLSPQAVGSIPGNSPDDVSFVQKDLHTHTAAGVNELYVRVPSADAKGQDAGAYLRKILKQLPNADALGNVSMSDMMEVGQVVLQMFVNNTIYSAMMSHTMKMNETLSAIAQVFINITSEFASNAEIAVTSDDAFETLIRLGKKTNAVLDAAISKFTNASVELAGILGPSLQKLFKVLNRIRDAQGDVSLNVPLANAIPLINATFLVNATNTFQDFMYGNLSVNEVTTLSHELLEQSRMDLFGDRNASCEKMQRVWPDVAAFERQFQEGFLPMLYETGKALNGMMPMLMNFQPVAGQRIWTWANASIELMAVNGKGLMGPLHEMFTTTAGLYEEQIGCHLPDSMEARSAASQTGLRTAIALTVAVTAWLGLQGV